ncbi:MAG TPA: DUF971 domain-containing protein [Ignavibacteria bacterium]|nr:DUF971 domain-containing protein [Ignavibacteria bacterium]HRJ99311.1 DUF971 domain-containing protein [Ignavibacteria bacterium]
MSPKKIKKTDDNKLLINWNDNSETLLDVNLLRDECPCVHCKGETVIFSSYIPIKDPFKAAGFYEIEKIETVGNYAIQIFWKDGHNTGIYSWEYLKELYENKKSGD